VGAESGGQGSRHRFDVALRRQSRDSVAWSVMRFLSDQFFSFVVFVLLARMLGVAEIGAFAIIAIAADVFRAISSAGLTQVVAREPVLSEEFTDTVYLSHLGASVIACGILLLAANPFASLLGAPAIAEPLQVLSLVLPISALGMTHMALRLREFGHRTTALRSIVSGLIAGGAAVAAAYAGFGVWALVIQRIVAEVVSVVLSRASYRWTPGLKFRREILHRNFGLSGSLTVNQLIVMLMLRLQELVIGAVIGLAAVGIYRTAWRTVELISNGAIRPFTTVAVQTLSRVKDDREQLGRAYHWMISKGAAVALPALVGFAVVAPLAVPTVFGDKWAEAGELARIFAFMALPFTLNLFASPALAAAGASRSLMVIASAQLGMTALFTVLAAPHGLAAVAWAYVARAYLGLPLLATLLRRATGIGFGLTWSAAWPPLAASLIMGAALYVALGATGGWAMQNGVRLVLLILGGALVYGLALLAVAPVWRERLRIVLAWVRRP
jgi:O-antigen/teichoic acid export membrane protein